MVNAETKRRAGRVPGGNGAGYNRAEPTWGSLSCAVGERPRGRQTVPAVRGPGPSLAPCRCACGVLLWRPLPLPILGRKRVAAVPWGRPEVFPFFLFLGLKTQEKGI